MSQCKHECIYLIKFNILIGLSQVQEKSAAEIQSVIDSIDTDGNGTINYTG